MKRRWAIACVAVVAFLATPVATALAHLSLESTDLVDGSTVDVAPATVHLLFDERVLLEASSAHVLTLGSGADMPLSVSEGAEEGEVVIGLPELGRGAYVLRYVMIDPEDLHRTVGSISFGVGVAAPPSEAGSQVGGSWPSLISKFAGYVGLVLAVGSTWLMVGAGGAAIGRVGRRWLARWASWAGGVVALAWAALVVDEARVIGFGNVSLSSLLTGSEPGRRALLAMQFALGLWWARRIHDRARDASSERMVARVMAGCAAGLVVVASFGGHASVGGPRWIGVVLRAAHIGAMSMWVGSVLAAVLLLRAGVAERPRQLWRAVSATATIGLAVVGLSGLLLSARLVTSATALFSTLSGRALATKALLTVAMAVMGAVAARRVATGQPMRLGSIRVELTLAALALVAAAVVAGAAPARGERFEPLAEEAPQVATVDAADLLVHATLVPARPGPNLLDLSVLDTRRPAPGPIGEVHVDVIDATGAVVDTKSAVPVDGLVSWADVRLPAPGAYQLRVGIDRAASTPPPVVVEVTASATPVPRAPTIVSDRPWASTAILLGLGWVVLVGVAAAVLRRPAARRELTAAATAAAATTATTSTADACADAVDACC